MSDSFNFLGVIATECRILGTTVFIGAIIATSWVLWDSMYLRFVILFLGVINALYAIWDVWLDGVKIGNKACSDCTQMAKIYNRSRPSHVSALTLMMSWFWLIRETRRLGERYLNLTIKFEADCRIRLQVAGRRDCTAGQCDLCWFVLLSRTYHRRPSFAS